MKNTIYLDSDFNFLLLENEEEDTGLSQTKIYINIPTSDATNQELEISVAGGAPITESIPSSAKVNFELSQQYWADNGDVEITPKNDNITGDTITIHFPETFTVSAALNYLYDDEFEIVAQNEDFAEGGGSGSGSGSGGGSAIDFVETIRNIGFRLLDEPSNVSAYFDEAAEEVQIKWTDPADILTNKPAPAIWAGTVVVRKEGSAPLHRWDGDLIVDSTTRDQYSNNALIDHIDPNKSYYYGIFPYDTKGDYRFTKIVGLSINEVIKTYNFADVIMTPDISHYKYVNSFTTEDLIQYINTDYNFLLLPYQSGNSYVGFTQPQNYDVEYRGNGYDYREEYYYFRLKKQYKLVSISGDIQILDFVENLYGLAAFYPVEPDLTRHTKYLLAKPYNGSTSTYPVETIPANDTNWYHFELNFNDMNILYFGFYSLWANVNFRNMKITVKERV